MFSGFFILRQKRTDKLTVKSTIINFIIYCIDCYETKTNEKNNTINHHVNEMILN